MGEPDSGAQSGEKQTDSRLDSWKEIAAYLGRDVTTVQRWEKREGMPVHRHQHDKRGSVYALASELDAWRRSRKAAANGDEAVPDAPEPAAVPATDGGAPSDRADSRSSRVWLAVAAAAAIALIAAGYALFPRHPSGAAQAKIRSIAVLPLKNMTGNPSQEYLADGMTDALISRLAGIRELRVISRTSVMRFKNPQMSVPQIAKILGVDAIVEGSVMREGNRIRVTAQLIRASTDTHFWSETYDRKMSDVFGLQSELAQSIAQKVEATVTGEERERLAAARTVAPEVFESYSKGRFALDNGRNKSQIEASIEYFNDAIEHDPTFAPAYVGLASAYNNLGTVFIGGSPDETRPKVMEAAKKAIALDPDLAEAHVLLASVLQEEWQWAESEAQYKRALELDPNSASAHEEYALWLIAHGRTDEAMEWAERGRERDPLAVSFEDYGWTLFQSRHYQLAERELRAAVASKPDDFGALMDLGFVLIADGKPQEAIPALEKAAEMSHRSPGALGILVRAYAHTGRRSDALRLIAELKLRGKRGYVPAGAMVNAYLGIGDNEQAFAWLEQASKEKSNMLQYVKVHPFFDPIRNDPRFADLVRRVGLT